MIRRSMAMLGLLCCLTAACSSSSTDASPDAFAVDSAGDAPTDAVDETRSETADSRSDVSSDTGGLACTPWDQVGCTDPARPKCTLVETTSGVLDLQCLAVTGTKGRGEVCTRTTVGIDDCAARFWCTRADATTPTGTNCRQWCHANADCESTDVCVLVIGGFSVCGPTCVPFGTGCPADMKCQLESDVESTPLGFCGPLGAAVAGDTCGTTADCGRDLVCDTGSTRRCRAMCDTAHPCTAGACVPANPPSDLGLCMP